MGPIVIAFETDQLLEPGLKSSFSAPVPAQWRKQEHKVGEAGKARSLHLVCLNQINFKKEQEQHNCLCSFTCFPEKSLIKIGQLNSLQ